MLKQSLVLGFLSLIITTGVAFADTVQQIQSPIYTDDIGRSHFLGKGGYSTVRHIQMGEANAAAVNEAVNNLSKKDTQTNVENSVNEVKENLQKAEDKVQNAVDKTEINILDVIKEKQNVPVSTKAKASFTSEQQKMDTSAPFGKGNTNLSSGVNESKTLYTDEIGRLHFFGKGNIVKE